MKYETSVTMTWRQGPAKDLSCESNKNNVTLDVFIYGRHLGEKISVPRGTRLSDVLNMLEKSHPEIFVPEQLSLF